MPGNDLVAAGFNLVLRGIILGLRLRRSDSSLSAFIATSDNGDGLNVHLYKNGAWSGMVKISETGNVYISGALTASNLPVIETGVEIMNPTANTVTTANITFSKTFASAPKVMLTPRSGNPSQITGLAVTDTSATGFTINLVRTNTTETYVNWMAIG